MNSIYNFIISTGNRYNNTVEVEDKELIVNTEITERDAVFVNRIGTVVGTPLAIHTPVEIGDEVIVHHNIFRRWFDVRGNERNSGDYIDEDKYKVAMDQVFAYRRPGGEWLATPGYCFVEPIVGKTNNWDTSNELELIGHIQIGNELLGLDRGDLVGFRPNTEYEFTIDGKKLYRIYSNFITWTSKKNAKELSLQLK